MTGKIAEFIFLFGTKFYTGFFIFRYTSVFCDTRLNGIRFHSALALPANIFHLVMVKAS